jgi:hypothetical protein
MKQDFLYAGNWFDLELSKKLEPRFHTTKVALNLLLQLGGNIIVETGCARNEDDWGAGLSTVIFGKFAKRYNMTLTSVDISKQNLAMAAKLSADSSEVIKFVEQDSVGFLKEYDGKLIDLLYLDSWDYPYGELLDIYGGKTDIHKAIEILGSMSDDSIVLKHNNVIEDCQNHCLKELQAAIPHLSRNGIILIDDSDLPGGGKARLAKIWLSKNHYTCILDQYQSLWIKL